MDPRRSRLPALSALRAAQPRCVAQLERAWAHGRLYTAYVLLSPSSEAAALLAGALAQSVLCAAGQAPARSGFDACGLCPACQKVQAGSHPDMVELQPIKGASRVSLEAAEKARRRLALVANEGVGKLLICERADCLSPAVQNSLLKAIEEPSGNTLFILIARSRGGLLPTLRSRAQILVLRPGPAAADLAGLVTEGIDPQLHHSLAAVFGADREAARLAVEQGFGDSLAALLRVLQGDPSVDAALAAAADLGADAVHFDHAMRLLELMLHHTYRQRSGVGAATPEAHNLCLPASLSWQRLEKMAQILQRLRRANAINLNRSLALGELLLPLVA
jgi:hypothetical protein